jgi:hypothetical protein
MRCERVFDPASRRASYLLRRAPRSCHLFLPIGTDQPFLPSSGKASWLERKLFFNDALVVALACLFALLLLLIAFVPCMSERVSAIISALRRK